MNRTSPLQELGFEFKTMADLTAKADEAYRDAMSSINRRDVPFVKSCGTILWMLSHDESKLNGITTDDCHEFNYTVKELVALMKKIEADGLLPYVKQIGLWGRIDGYESPEAFKFNDYMPEVASWELDIFNQEFNIKRELTHVVADC